MAKPIIPQYKRRKVPDGTVVYELNFDDKSKYTKHQLFLLLQRSDPDLQREKRCVTFSATVRVKGGIPPAAPVEAVDPPPQLEVVV